MQIIKANKAIEHVPADLRGLQVLKRSPVSRTVRICAVGDIGFSGRMSEAIKIWGAEALFKEVAPLLHSSDIAFANLESPLAGNIAPGKVFSAPPIGASALRSGGFNLVHLANNHISDFGKCGITATLLALSEAGITPLGIANKVNHEKELIRTDSNDLHIGWLACGCTFVPQVEGVPQYWEFDKEELLAAVHNERPTVDILIVSIHIGFMFLDYPHPDHKMLGEQLMKAGVDLILMHHAHVLQGIQVSNSGQVCCYNLGNFLWDPFEGDILPNVVAKEQEEGGIFVIDVDKDGIASLVVLPTWIDSNSLVRWAVDHRGENILRRLHRVSVDLGKNYQKEFDRQRVQRNFGHSLRDVMFFVRHGDWKYVFNRVRRVRMEHFHQIIRYPFIK